MIVREMLLSDLDGVMEVESLSFKSPWERASFESELLLNKLAHYFVVEEKAKIIGYVGFWHIVDEGHITNVAIHPQFRRQGIAKLMIDALIDYAKKRNIEYLTLEVRVTNDPAIKLYEGFGFKSHGVRPNYYQDTGEDALIMWAELKGEQE